jgi:hypothetical protein
MDIGFIDLDILLTRIRNPKSKVYFLDAVKAYRGTAGILVFFAKTMLTI